MKIKWKKQSKKQIYLEQFFKHSLGGYFMIFNDAITQSKLPSSLNMANMKTVFKKGTKVLNETYKSISISCLWFWRFGG